ncbi:DUF4336 domain-containing protein [Haloferula sp.]|uniref:DUF4336 domain-containing protein n=1 Tax=Haloferula sp. TaxID=2497595 RepID=UPI003C779D5A
MRNLSENIWLLTYPLRVFGADIIRNVTVIRLSSGNLLIHSTGPFTTSDTKAIRQLGTPSWLVESMLDHDTFSREGQSAFPEIPYYAPPGFKNPSGLPVQSLAEAPLEWSGEIDILIIDGVPSFGEYVFLHRSSRTLIVTDLIFNYVKAPSLWTKLLLYPALGFHHAPGMSKRFRGAIKEKAAFRSSLEQIMTWDFDRIIVGHGQVIESGGKNESHMMFQELGFL